MKFNWLINVFPAKGVNLKNIQTMFIVNVYSFISLYFVLLTTIYFNLILFITYNLEIEKKIKGIKIQGFVSKHKKCL